MARLYHNTTSFFNYYYNANKLYNEKLDELDKTYKFPNAGFIEIYHIGKEEEMKAHYEAFDKIIKKNEVMIYKHPNARCVDNGRHLEGQSFVYKGQNARAVKEFEEILAKYAGSRITPDVQLWLAKTYYYMDNKEMTKNLLAENLVERPDRPFRKRFKGELAIFRSQLSIDEKAYEAAAYQLETNLKFVKGRNKRAKVHYLLGQLYTEIGNLPLALEHFAKTEKMSNDYSVAFKAKMQKAKTLIAMPTETQYADVYGYLYKLEKDEKNLDYLDQIYYELGQLETKQNNNSAALGYYKKSVDASTDNKLQKALSFYKLGQIYFYQKKNYDKAVAYFDSAALAIEPTAPEYKEIKLVQSSLKEYVEYKKTIALQDSMLWLASLSKEKLEEEIDKKIAYEKKKREEEEERLKEEELNQSAGLLNNNQPGAAATWAFDDPAKLAEGRLQFKQIWGERKNEDNWRRNNKEVVISTPEPIVDEAPKTPEDSAEMKALGERYKYYKGIPFEPEEQQAALDKIETAYYKLGGIYDQKLSQPDSALAMFSILLDRFPKTQYLLPANYSMYLIYKGRGNQAYLRPKNLILTDYPKSIYAMLINGASQEEIAEQTKDFEFAYGGLFKAYRGHEYESALGFSDYLVAQYKDHNDVKMDQVYYIRALCYGYLGQRDSLKNCLTYVVTTFPKSPVQPPAQRILDALNKQSAAEKVEDVLPKNNPTTPKDGEPTVNANPKDANTPVVATPKNLKADDPRFKTFNKDPKPTMPFYVMFFLDKNSIADTAGKKALENFNKEKFKDKKAFNFAYENSKKEKSIIYYVTRFNNEFEAVEYIWQLTEAGIVEKFQQNPMDKVLWITQENFTNGFSKKEMENYILFYENVLTK